MTGVITHNVPPQRLVTAVNPLVRLALRSPLHVVLDPALLVLHVVGARSGRRYDIPVGHVDAGGRLVVITQHRWRANLRGGGDIQVTYRGRRTPMHVELDEDPASVAGTLHEVIDRIGWKAARTRLGLTVTAGRTPTVAELQEAVREFDLATITLSTAPPPSGRDARDEQEART
jgi:hypothetical protein